MKIPEPKRVLQAWSALIGLCGATYLELLDEVAVELDMLTDALEWPFVIIGALGTGSLLVSAWKHRH
jgi:hypothetical protein